MMSLADIDALVASGDPEDISALVEEWTDKVERRASSGLIDEETCHRLLCEIADFERAAAERLAPAL